MKENGKKGLVVPRRRARIAGAGSGFASAAEQTGLRESVAGSAFPGALGHGRDGWVSLT